MLTTAVAVSPRKGLVVMIVAGGEAGVAGASLTVCRPLCTTAEAAASKRALAPCNPEAAIFIASSMAGADTRPSCGV